MRNRMISVCIALVVGFAMMTTSSFAADKKAKITLDKPKAGYTAYAGENLAVTFKVKNKNTKKGRDFWPWIRVFDSEKGSWSDYYATTGLVPAKRKLTFREKIKLKKVYPAKSFKVRVIAVPYLVGGKHPDYTKKKKGWEKGMIQKTVTIKMKHLFWPESLKLKASKGKIKLNFSKVKGATGYQIYRSTKKKGKYKSIGTTKMTSFTDKKVKKGKTYFYYVRSLRNKHGLIKSDPGPIGKMKAR